MKSVAALVLSTLLASALVVTSPFVHAENRKSGKSGKAAQTTTTVKRKPAVHQARTQPVAPATPRGREAEARLIDIYKLLGQAKTREALTKAEALVHDHPNFQLAQLVYGDLLTAHTRPVRRPGDAPDGSAEAAGPMLTELRQESLLRLKALREPPPPGMVPSQFLALSAANKHAIAVDASKSRLYLFEHTAAGMKLLADYYISVGKLGIEKNTEGDLRTPLGVYFITSNLNPRSLKDFYGSGALPVNYPNQLDVKRGKTGGGIWLHGTPPAQYSRAPLATDGCVVLSNPDLELIIRTVEIRTTPVVIAQSLKWLAPQTVKAESKTFEDALNGWHAAKSSGDITRVTSWYMPDFTSNGKTLSEWMPELRAEMDKLGGREVQLKDVSYLRWTDAADTMVVTFGELAKGARTGRVKRQYWSRLGNQWKIFYEGIIG